MLYEYVRLWKLYFSLFLNFTLWQYQSLVMIWSDCLLPPQVSWPINKDVPSKACCRRIKNLSCRIHLCFLALSSSRSLLFPVSSLLEVHSRYWKILHDGGKSTHCLILWEVYMVILSIYLIPWIMLILPSKPLHRPHNRLTAPFLPLFLCRGFCEFDLPPLWSECFQVPDSDGF